MTFHLQSSTDISCNWWIPQDVQQWSRPSNGFSEPISSCWSRTSGLQSILDSSCPVPLYTSFSVTMSFFLIELLVLWRCLWCLCFRVSLFTSHTNTSDDTMISPLTQLLTLHNWSAGHFPLLSLFLWCVFGLFCFACFLVVFLGSWFVTESWRLIGLCIGSPPVHF